MTNETSGLCKNAVVTLSIAPVLTQLSLLAQEPLNFFGPQGNVWDPPAGPLHCQMPFPNLQSSRYDVQRRPSLLEQSPLVYPVSGQIVAAPASAPAVLLDPNADINAILARQAAAPAPPAAAPAPAAPPAAPAAPPSPPVTLTAGVRRAFQVGVNWSNQRQQLGGEWF